MYEGRYTKTRPEILNCLVLADLHQGSSSAFSVTYMYAFAQRHSLVDGNLDFTIASEVDLYDPPYSFKWLFPISNHVVNLSVYTLLHLHPF